MRGLMCAGILTGTEWKGYMGDYTLFLRAVYLWRVRGGFWDYIFDLPSVEDGFGVNFWELAAWMGTDVITAKNMVRAWDRAGLLVDKLSCTRGHVWFRKF